MTSLATHLLALCADLGATHAFVVDGADVAPLVGALRNHPRLNLVPVPTEACAAAMAEGLTRRSGRPALVVACGGPGAASLAPMVAQAAGSGGGVIVLTGIAGATPDACGWAAPDVPLLSAAGAESMTVLHAGDLERAVANITRGLEAGRVVHVAIGLEAQAVACEAVSAAESVPVMALPDASGHAVLAVGAGALAEGAAIVELARRMRWPLLTDMTARGVIAEDDPLCLGHVSYMPAPRAHAALAGPIGSRAHRIVALAPSPFLLERLTASGVPVDVVPASALAMWLNSALEQAPLGGEADPGSPSSPESLSSSESPNPLDHGTLVETVAALLGPDAVHVADAGVFHQSVAVRLCARMPRTILATDSLTAMGWGFGAAVGAALASPGVPVVAYVGDGSFHVQGLSLAVAARLGVQVLFVVADNGVLASARGRHAPGADDPALLPELDLLGVARACGVEAERCDDVDGVRAAVRTFQEGSGPRVVVVRTGTTDPVASGRPTGLAFLDGGQA